MTELEKALNGETYDGKNSEIAAFQNNVKKLCQKFNSAEPNGPERTKILAELVSGYNPYVFVESNFTCVFGKNIHFKGMAILNFNCTLLDSNIITIGDRTLIGPNCNIICTNHSIDADERLKGVFDNRPITIGSKVWIGANVTILPGVVIGDEAVIGAGSVVTKDIPAGVVAVGNPCRAIRQITENDKLLKKS